MTAIEAVPAKILSPGTEVEVLTRYERRWSSGFEIAAVDAGRFLVRRHSDGALLPASFAANEVRARRR